VLHEEGQHFRAQHPRELLLVVLLLLLLPRIAALLYYFDVAGQAH